MSDFRKQWNDTCKAAGLKPISTDTAARIMAVVYEFDREDITHCPKLLADIEYIQNEYGIEGGKIPHSDFQKLFAKYAKEIEDNGCEPTEWAKELMKDNYSITIKKNNNMGEIFMIPEQDESDASVKMYKILKDREKQNEGSKTNKSYILTDEEIVVKAFYDNAYKIDNWKDCCIAMIRDAIKLTRQQITDSAKCMVKLKN